MKIKFHCHTWLSNAIIIYKFLKHTIMTAQTDNVTVQACSFVGTLWSCMKQNTHRCTCSWWNAQLSKYTWPQLCQHLDRPNDKTCTKLVAPLVEKKTHTHNTSQQHKKKMQHVSSQPRLVYAQYIAGCILMQVKDIKKETMKAMSAYVPQCDISVLRCFVNNAI